MVILRDYQRQAKPAYAPFLSGIPCSPRLVLLIGSEQIPELLLSRAAESAQSNAAATCERQSNISYTINESSVFQECNLQTLVRNLGQTLIHNLTV